MTEITDASTKRKREILDMLHRQYGTAAYRIISVLVCNVCGMKMYGKGSLLHDSEWVDVCRCGYDDVSNKDSRFSLLPEGSCLVWDEEPLQ